MGLAVFGLSLAAKFFGVSVERDVWLLSLNFIVVVEAMVWGPINETFRAKFVLLKEKLGEQAVLDKTKSLLLLTGLLSVALVITVMVFRIPISRLLAPGFDEPQIRFFALMLMVSTPSLLVNQFSHIGISVLNAYESYFLPEITSSIAALVNIIALLFLAPYMGIFSLLVAYYFGLLLMLVLVVRQLRKKRVGIFGNFANVRIADFMPFLLYALPFFVPYFFVQLNLVIEKSLGNLMGEGTVSVMDYARKFIDIPMQVMQSVMLTLLVPILSSRFAKKDPDGFLLEFRRVLQLGLLVVTFIIAFFSTSANELITLILDHGQLITADTIALISDLSVYYAWSSLVIFSYLIFGLALLSSNKGWIYAILGVVPQVLMIALNFIFYKEWGVYVFPLSLLLSHVFSAVVLFLKFPGNNMRLLMPMVKYLAILVLSVAASNWVIAQFSVQFQSLFFTVAWHVAVIGMVVLLLMVIFRAEELVYIKNGWRNLMRDGRN